MMLPARSAAGSIAACILRKRKAGWNVNTAETTVRIPMIRMDQLSKMMPLKLEAAAAQ